MEVGKRKRDNFTSASWEAGVAEKVTNLPVRSWRLGEWKRDHFNSASWEVGGAEKRQFYQCELGSKGSEKGHNLIVHSWRFVSGKETILPVQAWRWKEQKETILPVRAWRLGKRKRDNFTSAILEVRGAEKRQL